MRRYTIRMAAMALLAALLLSGTASASRLTDISASWARADIEALLTDGVINGYPDRTFRPDNPVTRAEFSRILARAFHYEASGKPNFPDIQSHWAKKDISALAEKGIIKGYPDGNFHPDARINRAEMTTMLTRALKLDNGFQSTQFGWWPTFTDVTESHWAYNSVEIASRLGILPPVFETTFKPDQATNRAETAAMVRAARDLTTLQGTLKLTDNQSTIMVAPSIGQPLVLELAPDASILRNSTRSQAANLVEGDQVYVVASNSGSAQFVNASGIVTQADVVSKVTDLSQGLVTKEQLAALVRGDWQTVRDEMKYSLYDQLLQNGIRPHEAEALLTQDWTALEGLGQERLAEALAQQWDIPVELIVALLDRDWKTAQEYGQVELTQRLLGGLLNDSAN
ncbi:MAG: S-layer homology domain-containing protein [Firmicutes bacterium]|nr:S-layer homology domain-containing protein [Bacillota bacterium]